MSEIEERNKKVFLILEQFYKDAKGKKISDSFVESKLDVLFSTSAWGFREIVFVVCVAMKLNKDFRASTALYDCNPRALFEGPIKEFFIKNNFPHRQSGPLNVAKATKGLNNEWAIQRRPADVAKVVVELVDYIEQDPAKRVDLVGILLCKKYISISKELKKLEITIAKNNDPIFLFDLCKELITKTPDSGNTPQKIAGLLLKNYHLSMSTGVVVTGLEDRASVTSTTSKKPGDINEENKDGTIYKIYEITVKPFDKARIIDSCNCVNIYNSENGTNIKEITVICRKEDCPSDMEPSGLNLYLGRFINENIVYYFWDLFEWIASMLQKSNDNAKELFYKDLNDYINAINTNVEVKKLWQKLHNK